VFGSGLGEDGDVLVGVLPESEEFLISSLGLRPIACQKICPAQLQVRESAYGVGEDDAAMVEDFLEFRGRFRASPRFQISLTAHIRGVKSSELSKESRTRES